MVKRKVKKSDKKSGSKKAAQASAMPKVEKAAPKSFKHWLGVFGDKALLALEGAKGLLKKPAYLATFLIASFVFAYVFTFFKDGTMNWSLVFSGLDFSEKLKILGQVVPEIFTGLASLYGISIFAMSLLQGLCIALMVYAWKNRERDSAIDGASTGGIGALLGFIALGCPSCGVTFITPILTAIAGTGAMALTESVSQIFTILAFVLLIYTVIQLGYVDFVITSAKKYEEKHE